MHVNMEENICCHFRLIIFKHIFKSTIHLYMHVNVFKREKNTERTFQQVIKFIFFSAEEVGQGFWSINELGEREKGRKRRGEAVMFDVGM